jgi:hypothetical protein
MNDQPNVEAFHPVCDIEYRLLVRANTPTRRLTIEATYDLQRSLPRTGPAVGPVRGSAWAV